MYEFQQIQTPKGNLELPTKILWGVSDLRDGQIAAPTYQDCLRHKQSQ